jgi:hypothetical protein
MVDLRQHGDGDGQPRPHKGPDATRTRDGPARGSGSGSVKFADPRPACGSRVLGGRPARGSGSFRGSLRGSGASGATFDSINNQCADHAHLP